MFSNSSFELSNSKITNIVVTEDTLILGCRYMKMEPVDITFVNVTKIKNYAALNNNTINYINSTDDGFEIYYMDEKQEPTIIYASGHRIDWK